MSDLNFPPNPTSQTPKRRRGLRIALILSLMVNLLVIGALVGGAMRMRALDGPLAGPPHGQADIRALWRALPGEARAQLRNLAREQGLPGDHTPRPSREERRAQAAALNARILEALRAEPFDAETFGTLLHGDREALQRRLDAANAIFAAQLAALSPADRAQMAQRLEEQWENRLPGRDRD